MTEMKGFGKVVTGFCRLITHLRQPHFPRKDKTTTISTT